MRQAVAQTDSSSQPFFAPVEIAAIEEEAAQIQAERFGNPRQVEVRLGETGQISLHLIAGHGFQAKPLPCSTPGRPVPDVRPTGWYFPPVKIALVDHDLAGDAQFRVDADAEHETARARFFHHDVDVDGGRTGAQTVNGGRDDGVGGDARKNSAGRLRQASPDGRRRCGGRR